MEISNILNRESSLVLSKYDIIKICDCLEQYYKENKEDEDIDETDIIKTVLHFYREWTLHNILTVIDVRNELHELDIEFAELDCMYKQLQEKPN